MKTTFVFFAVLGFIVLTANGCVTEKPVEGAGNGPGQVKISAEAAKQKAVGPKSAKSLAKASGGKEQNEGDRYRERLTKLPPAWRKWSDHIRFMRDLERVPVGDDISLTSRFSGIAMFRVIPLYGPGEVPVVSGIAISLEGTPASDFLKFLSPHAGFVTETPPDDFGDWFVIYSGTTRLGRLGMARLDGEEVAFVGDFYRFGKYDETMIVCRRLSLVPISR